MNFSGFDLILLVISGFIIIRATIRGFLLELFSTANIVVSFAVSFLFYKDFETVLAKYVKAETFLPLLSFLALFIICSIAIKLLHLMLSGILKNDTISSLDHALGFFLGLVKAFCLIAVVILVLSLQKFVSVEKLFSESILVNFMLPIISYISEIVSIFGNNLKTIYGFRTIQFQKLFS